MFTENSVKTFKPNMTDKTQLFLTRASLAVSGIISLLIALFAETIYKLAVLSNTTILVGMAAPYLIGMYWKKGNHIGALASFFSGVISWLAIAIFTYPTTLEMYEDVVDVAIWDAIYIASAPAFLISVIVFIVASLTTQKINSPKILTDINGNPVDMRNILARGKPVSPEN